jgi:hypothetical protein
VCSDLLELECLADRKCLARDAYGSFRVAGKHLEACREGEHARLRGRGVAILDELVCTREVDDGLLAVASVPGGVSEERLGLGCGLGHAGFEQRGAGELQSMQAPVVAREMKRPRPPE